jgi:hypothetical protein
MLLGEFGVVGSEMSGLLQSTFSRYMGRLPSLLGAAVSGTSTGDLDDPAAMDVGSGGDQHPAMEHAAPIDQSPDGGRTVPVAAAAASKVPRQAQGPFVRGPEPPAAAPNTCADAAPAAPPSATAAWPSIVRALSSRSGAASGAALPGSSTLGFSFSSCAASSAGRYGSATSRWAAGDAPFTDTSFDGAASSDDESPVPSPNARATAKGVPSVAGGAPPSNPLSLNRIIGLVRPAGKQSQPGAT